MTVELINTGTELMLGRVLNTHQQWLCRQLADLGYVVSRQVAVADTGPAILEAVREALSRADLVITTGGLGPTSDDLTRDLVAQLLGKALHEEAAVLADIQQFFDRLKRPMPGRARLQALVPEGALVLRNPHGTAPGLAIEVRPNPFREGGMPAWLVMLPGPPRELWPMFTGSVAPLLSRVLPPLEQFFCRTLRTVGIGESVVEQKIGKPLRKLAGEGLDVGYCAQPWQVDVRLAGRGTDAVRLVHEGEQIVRAELGNFIFAQGDESLAEVMVRSLTERRQTLALAESCTGGSVADALTNVPGASAVLIGGVVAYSNDAKRKFLGDLEETLAEHGAVSEPVARLMAEGACREFGADYGLSVTGIAGPSGGTEAKPVGTVFMAVASESGTMAVKHFNPYDRATFKQVTVQQVLNLLRLNSADTPADQ